MSQFKYLEEPNQSPRRRKALKKHHSYAMEHYLAYLKSDAGPIDTEEANDESEMTFSPSIKEIWTGPVVYPPFED